MKELLEHYDKLFLNMFNDLKTKGNRHKQIPNILTMCRLVAPFIVMPAFVIGNIPFALGSIIAFSITDALDGFIARTFHLTSEFGRDLDTLADKVFAGTLLMSLTTINPTYLISLVLEVAIGSVCAYKKVNGIDMKTCMTGKVKTVLLDIFVIAGIGSIIIDVPVNIINILFGMTTAFQAVTVKEYFKVEKEKIEEIEIQQEKIEEKEENSYSKSITYPKQYFSTKKKNKTKVKSRFEN